MIKERVGMRVKHQDGRVGKIIRVDGDDIPRVEFDNGRKAFVSVRNLTEIKEDNMYLDEALKVVREDENMEFSWGDKCEWFDLSGLRKNGMPNMSFPNESDFTVRAKKPVIKEVTMAELEEKYGCKVKVVK